MSNNSDLYSEIWILEKIGEYNNTNYCEDEQEDNEESETQNRF